MSVASSSVVSAAPVASPAEPVSFASLGLSKSALSALAAAGFEKPTPIQAQAIPPALSGRDVIGCAATGTGKTAAFVLPLLERLTARPEQRALILAPTRELAVQIGEQINRLRIGKPIHFATLIGGVGMGNQIKDLREAQLIVATPGRLIDHLEGRTAKLDQVAFLVLDEADRMLDMGFKPQLTKILARVPAKRQTMLFSATMADEVAQFARTHLKDPVKVEVAKSGTTASRAVQKVYECSQGEKTALLMALLAEDGDSTLVFTRTKRRADRVARSLERTGQSVARIHADRSQSQRLAALEGFRGGKYRILVATDIAARGIDVAEIGHVVNYDLPHVPADYVHRVGRTARAAASGRASSFVSPEEAPLLRDIEKFVRVKVPRGEVPRASLAFLEEISVGATRDSGGGHRGSRGGPRRSGGGGAGARRSGGGRSGGGRSSGSSSAASAVAGASSGGSSSGRVLFSGGPRRR